MTVAEDIRTVLIAGLVGDSAIFLQGMPALPDDVIAVQVSGGPPPVLTMGPTVVERMTTFQVMTRGPRGEGEAVEARMLAIHLLLQALGTTAVSGGDTYDKITALSEPFQVQGDSEERPIWACNYEAWAPGP